MCIDSDHQFLNWAFASLKLVDKVQDFFSKKLLKVQKAVVSKYKQLWRKKIWLIQDMTNHVILHYAKKAVTQAYYGGDFYVRPILICFLNYVIIFQLQLMLMPSDFFSIFYYTRKKREQLLPGPFSKSLFLQKTICSNIYFVKNICFIQEILLWTKLYCVEQS